MYRFSRYSAPRLLYFTVCSSTAPPSRSSSLLGSTFHLRHFSAGNLARAKDSREPWSKESVERLRNIWISAIIDPGKTTLKEPGSFGVRRYQDYLRQRKSHRFRQVLYNRGVEKILDTAVTYCTWKDYKINIIETPGHVDFTNEDKRALRVLDGAILVLSSVDGVQFQSITIDQLMRRYEVPRLAFIDNLDQMGANPWKVLSQARSKLQHHSAAIQVPIGLEDDFKGLVDLVQLKAYYFHDSNGENVVAEEIPADMEALVSERRHELIETVSEVDDKLAEAFHSDKPISAADLEEAVRRATIARKFIPVFMGSAFRNKGQQPLLDGVLNYLPCPIEVSNYALDQTKNEKVELSGSPDGPLVALAFKLEDIRALKSERVRGRHFTYLRIYEGVIRKGDFIINGNTGKKTKVALLGRMHSNELLGIQEAHAGEIITIFDVDCASGDTFTDGSVSYTMTSMNVPKPVSKDSGEQLSKASVVKKWPWRLDFSKPQQFRLWRGGFCMAGHGGRFACGGYDNHTKI